MISRSLPLLAVLSLFPLSRGVAGSAVHPAPFDIMSPAYPTVIFNDTVLPSSLIPGPGARLEVTDKLFKSDEKRSLHFAWDRPGASFSWKNPDAFKNVNGANPNPVVYQWCVFNTMSTFKVWVFNDKPVNDRVWFEIGTADRTDVRFYMNLNFSGWRQLAAMYGRDIRAIPGADADTMRVIAPSSVPAGSLWFDLLEPRSECDSRFVNRTPEAPWVKNIEAAKAGGGLCTDPAIANTKGATPEFVKVKSPAVLDAAQLGELAALTEKFMARYDAPAKPRSITASELAGLRDTYSRHRLVRVGKLVSGRTLGARDLWSNIGKIAEAWASAEQPEVREELRQKAFDLIDIMTQQGHGIWYGANANFTRPLLLLREELVATGRWTPLLQKLRETYRIHDLTQADIYGDADAFNTWMHGQIAVILLGEDGPDKWRDLLELRRYLDFTADFGEIKGDGSFFHHDMTYSGYNVPAIEALGDALRLLKGSPFFPRRMHEVIRRSAWVMRFYSCETEMPHYMGGRWRTTGSVAPTLFRDMAECGDPVTGDALDREMAALYLGYARKDSDSARYAAMGIAPLKPTGNLALPYSVSSFHRRGDWMIGVHGQKKQFRCAEAYGFQNGNTMGRYMAFGQTFIHSKRPAPGKPITVKASGFEPDKGWDYARWPGTTARAIPNDALRSHFLVEEMSTTEGYAGGTSLDGNGLFAMKLQEDLPGSTDELRLGPCKWWLGEAEYQKRVKDACYDTTFRARKSWFFFDDCTVCLGSDITAKDPRYPINTTLFQNALNAAGKYGRFAATEQPAAPFPMNITVPVGAGGHWMMDSSDNGYWVPAGNNPLRLVRETRSLPYHPYWLTDFIKSEVASKTAQMQAKHDSVLPNVGDMELAWFDHGAAPAKPAGYEYAILVDTTVEAMRRFASEPRYRVLRKDTLAHVVADAPTRSVGYALFEAGSTTPVSGLPAGAPAVKAVSKPCMLMMRVTDAGAIRMSFADPDPNLKPIHGKDGSVLDWGHDGISAPATHTRVSLSGRWRVKGSGSSVITASESETVIDFACVESVPVVVDLEPDAQ